MTLFEFADVFNYDERLEKLAEKAAKDNDPWTFSEEQSYYDNRPFAILRRYIEYTFQKLYLENKIKYTNDKKYASFNTGLVTENLEDIYSFFEKHNTKGKYFLKGFFKESEDAISTNFGHDLPKTANYFENPADLLYDPNRILITRYDHIIRDNKERWVRKLGPMTEKEIRQTLMGAIPEIEKMVRNNYKIAIPQFRFDEERGNRIQLLLPLTIERNGVRDTLALVVDKVKKVSVDDTTGESVETQEEQNKTYIATTCLELPMAYTNARLIVKPASDWLKP